MRDKVKRGYEEGDYTGAYRDDREIQGEEELLFEKMFDRLESNRILDLGCGTGVPFDQFLAKNDFEITGVDIAEKHIKKARDNVPEANFIQGGFFEQDFESGSFDAVVSFYAVFHIPRDEHSKLFEKINYWLKDEGILLFTVPNEELEMHEGEIKGGEMVWSSYSPERNKELLREAGFDIIETYTEDWREETHVWILAKAN